MPNYPLTAARHKGVVGDDNWKGKWRRLTTPCRREDDGRHAMSCSVADSMSSSWCHQSYYKFVLL